jgi:single-stranded-DNA-specific exonuclease
MEKSKVVYSLKKMSSDKQKYSQLLKDNNVFPVMADLYALRGVKDISDINLIQKLEPFHSMKGIEAAAKMLAQAILKKEKICVVADYDVDGATAGAIAVRGLKMFGALVDYMVPNRFKHGYGLKVSVVDEVIKRKNPDLIITVDNGIAAYEGVDYAHKKGIKVLVTDHHLTGDTPPEDKSIKVDFYTDKNGKEWVLPHAEVIVNPNQPDCDFKNKSLAGCGVMFYVLAALRSYMVEIGAYTDKTVPNVFSLLDLVAIGTVADVVKLEKNNRILVKLGLDMIKKGKGVTKAGILALCKVSGTNFSEIGTTDVGFRLGPRLNAAGRLEDMSIGINCLLTDSEDTANRLAEELNEINKKRRLIEGEMKDQALELPSLKEGGFSKVAYDASFHEGVIGIVASRIKDMFYRPTIVFAPAEQEGYIKGSGRSISEINLRDALDYVHKKNPEVLSIFGGHAMAAGLSIKHENLEKFIELFEEGVEYFAEGQELKNTKEIDMNLPSNFINLETAETIKNEIWGQGFPQPLFMGEFNILSQKILKEAHLKLQVEKEGLIYDAIWFSQKELMTKDTVNLVYTLDINDFRDNKTVQLLVDGVYDL